MRSALPYQDNLSALIHEPTFKQRGRRGSLQQGAADQHASATAPSTTTAADPGAASQSPRSGAVPRLLLARPHLRDEAPASPGTHVRPRTLPADSASGHADRREAASAEGVPRRARREADRAARRQGRSSTTKSPPARRGRQGEEGERGQHADTHDYSEAETRTTSSTCCSPRPAGRSTEARDREFEVTGMPNRAGQGLRRLRAVGRRRQAARARRGEADHQVSAGRPAAGQAVRRLPGGAVRPAAGHLLHQRLRALALGRPDVPAARGPGLLHEGRAGTADPAPHQRASRSPRAEINNDDRRAVLPRPAPSAGSPRRSSTTTSARRCW